MGESFRYIGCLFDFNMSELSSLVQNLMNDMI